MRREKFMLSWLKGTTESYYHFWLRLANLKNKAAIFPIDFKQHWTKVILEKKIYLIFSSICVTVIQSFYSTYPMLFEKIMANVNYTYFLFLLLFWLFIIVLEYISVYCAALLEVQCINSVLYNAFLHFLTVDPLYHTMKSTGKLFAKVERCARAYEEFLDIILWDIMPIVVSMLSVTISFFMVDITLGLVALLLLLSIAAINIFLNLYTSFSFESRLIEADDSMKALAVESLTLVQLIRSSFATDEIAMLCKQASTRQMYKEGTAWLAFATSVTISRLAYLTSIFVLGWIVFSLIQAGSITTLKGTAILITYLVGTYEVIEIGRRLRKLLRSITRITDLYSYIQMFGKQTFPVLAAPTSESHVPSKTSTIKIQARDIHFYYNPQAKIFDGHSLSLELERNQSNKLYGIIGPSGMGKTTLLSLLGGQLKPDKGIVMVNGVPIYQVDDATRRHLITMQGQIASNLSGTLKRNLLLGLPPDKQVYTDEEIIRILQKVGLWHIFKEKQGLASPIGEAGLTLSGGQRQRLNFTSLYLRAKYYNPALILIDEPTSSLDEISEQAITTMISELAEKALTIVIAHRLKTLEDAVGILDFSLIDQEKEIKFYERHELEMKSEYYKMLMMGDIPLEDL